MLEFIQSGKSTMQTSIGQPSNLYHTGKRTTLRAAFGAAFAAAWMAAASPVASAQSSDQAPSAHETEFNVKFGALTVGNMIFGVSMDGQDYTFTGKGSTKGLAEWFASGKAVIKSQGQVSGHDLLAASHYLSVTEKNKTAVLKMSFNKGDVQDVFLDPDKRKKSKNSKKYVLIQPDDLKHVVDPASTMVIPVDLAKAKDPLAVCGHTFRVYDGETRFDMRLSYKRNEKISTKGYDGYAYVCKLQYVPVAGHKRDNKSTMEMAANKDLEIWLAPINGGGKDQSIFTAIRIVVPTSLGTFSAEPEYFGPKRS
jgi:hypothetical protein